VSATNFPSPQEQRPHSVARWRQHHAVEVVISSRETSPDVTLGRRFSFQQDDDPQLSAKVTLRGFRGNVGFTFELNPSENLWHDLKVAVHQQKLSNLKEQLWFQDNPNRCGKLIETHPTRL